MDRQERYAVFSHIHLVSDPIIGSQASEWVWYLIENWAGTQETPILAAAVNTNLLGDFGQVPSLPWALTIRFLNYKMGRWKTDLRAF